MLEEDWNESLEYLIESGEAADYLATCFRASDPAFLLGLRELAKLGGGMGLLAKVTGLRREGLYRTLSANGNPRLSSLRRILEALGLELRFARRKATRGERPGASAGDDLL